MGSHSIGHDSFEHPRVGPVRVSTIAFDEPQKYGHGPTFRAETIVFVGPHLEARVGYLRRYFDVDLARRRHVGIVRRAQRGHHPAGHRRGR